MARFSIHKTEVVPGTMLAHAVYVVGREDNPGFIEIYVTDGSGTARRVIDEERVAAMIADAVAVSGAIYFVEDIAERNALELESNAIVWVANASADSTVTAGGAKYFYNHATETFIKTAEEESMDLVLTWAALQDKPTSSVADIDDAVTKRHAHTNLAELNKVGEDGDGNFTYNGAPPSIVWGSADW